jgi:hypothetical protein
MKNKLKPLLLILGSWNFGITSIYISYFTNSSPFLLSHEIRVLEVILSLIFVLMIFPGSIYLIYLLLSNKKKFQKQFIVFFCTVFISNGLIKNIEKFFEFDLITYWLVFVGFLLSIGAFSAKFLFNNNYIYFISIFFPLQIVFLYFQTDIPEYFNINKSQKVEKFTTNGKNINLIVLDEFSLSQIMRNPVSINRDRFPGFYKLSQVTNFYPYTTSNAGHTDSSLPSILTGQLPDRKSSSSKTKVNYYYPENIINLLSNSYSIKADELVTNFCLNLSCKSSTTFKVSNRYRKYIKKDLATISQLIILPKSYVYSKYPRLKFAWGNFESIDEDREFQESYLTASRLSSLEDFINSEKPKVNNNFNLIHVLFPHNPYEYLSDGRRLTRAQAVKLFPVAQDLTIYNEEMNQAYLHQLKYLDNLIYRLALKMKYELNDEIVIITSDHGVSFQPNKSWRGDFDSDINDSKTMASVLRVPLFIHYPKQKNAQTILKKIQLIDLYPTILREIEFPLKQIESKIDGIEIQSSVNHSGLNWDNPKFSLNELDIEKGFEELILQNNDKFGYYLGKCDLFSIGPFKDQICRSISNFRVKNSKLQALFSSRDEILKVNPEINQYKVDFIVYGDNLSKILEKDPLFNKWFAISYNNQIVSITKGKIIGSLRDEGKARDLNVSAVLFGIYEPIEVGRMKLYEFEGQNTIQEIDFK